MVYATVACCQQRLRAQLPQPCRSISLRSRPHSLYRIFKVMRRLLHSSASVALAAQLLDQQQCITICSRHASLLQTALLTTAQQSGSRFVSFGLPARRGLNVNLQALHSSVGLPAQRGSNHSSDSCQSISSDQDAAAILQHHAWDVHSLSCSSQQQRQLLCGQPALPQHTPVQFPAAALHAVLGPFKATSTHAAAGGRAYSAWQGQQQQQQQQQRRSSLQQWQQQPTWRRGQQQQQQQQQQEQPTQYHLQQQQHYPVTPWKIIQDPRLAKLATEAFAPQHSRQERADILHAALDWCLQQLTAAAATNQNTPAQQLHIGALRHAGMSVSPTDISALLHCFEVARTAVHWPAMQELVQYMDGTAHLYDCKVILRVLRSASFSKLAAPHSSSSSDGSSRGGSGGSAPTSNLLQRVWDLTQQGVEPLRPLSVPQLLRCASVLQDSMHHQQQQRMPNEPLDSFICHWLDGCGVGSAEDLSSSSSSIGTISSSSSSSKQQMAQQAAVIIKAVHAMNMQVGGPVLQRLLLPVQAVLQDCTAPSSSSSSSSAGRAIEAAAWVPTLLTATFSLDRDSVLSNSQQGQALELASKTSQALAGSAAPAAAGLNSSSSSIGEAAVASSILDVAKSLSTIQRASPIKKIDGLVDGLTLTLITGASFRQLSAFSASLASLNLAPSLSSMANLTAAACAQLQQQQEEEEEAGRQQQQQQQRRRQQWQDRNSMSQFLWASAAMGYSLGAHELQVLLQQLLRVEGPVTGQVAQAMWAIALMGSQQQQQQQQQQQWDHSLAPPVAELACQLLSRVLAEQQALAGSSSYTSAGAYSSSSSSSSSQRVGQSFVDLDAWMGPERDIVSMHGHASWQLSVVAWAAAMCDLTMCKDTVLGLCSILARPHMWSALRQAEHVQLLLVQLWLSGDYQWSDTKGLARVLTPEQLELLRQAKLAQTLRATADAAAVIIPAATAKGGAGAAARAAAAAAAKQAESAGQPAWVLKNASPVTSLSQLALWRTLKKIPSVQSAELEDLTLDQLFNVDVLVTLKSGKQLAVEFDGPYHFAVAVPSAAAAAAGGCGGGSSGEAAEESVVIHQQQQQRQHQGATVIPASGRAAVKRTMPTGKSQQQQQQKQPQQQQQGSGLTPQLVPVRRVLFRNKVLAARGLRVVSVPYYEWREQQTRPKRQQYLQRLIREAQPQ